MQLILNFQNNVEEEKIQLDKIKNNIVLKSVLKVIFTNIYIIMCHNRGAVAQ